MNTMLHIDGMASDRCAMRVRRALERLPRVTAVHVRRTSGAAIVTSEHALDETLVADAVEGAGYILLGMLGRTDRHIRPPWNDSIGGRT